MLSNSSFARSFYINRCMHTKTKFPVVLTQDMDKLGVKGEVIAVAKGYARNYLYPKKFAMPATEEARAKYPPPGPEVFQKRSSAIVEASIKKKISRILLTFRRKEDSLKKNPCHST